METYGEETPLLQETSSTNNTDGLNQSTVSNPEPVKDELDVSLSCRQDGAVGSVNNDPSDNIVKPTAVRYYILTLFSIISMVQGGVWNTWSPISQSAKRVFHWTDGDIALLADWGPITYVICMGFFSWLMDTKGLRVSCVVCSFLLAAGAGMRCITFQQPWANWLIHAGQIFNGLGGPVAMSACTVISAYWFPPNERTTATSIGAMFNFVGVAVSFLIGPLLVPQNSFYCNMTLVSNLSYSQRNSQNVSGSLCPDNDDMQNLIEQEAKDIMKLQYIEFGVAAVAFLATLVYFPSRPPYPPSLTASVDRQDFKQGLKALMTNGNFWIVCSVYGLCMGIENTWLSFVDIYFNPLGVTQDQAGWLGFYSIVAGCLGSVVVARFADLFARRMKAYTFGLFVLSAACFVWTALMFIQVLPFQIVYLYISVIFGALCLNSTVPLLYELSCELTFPVSEGVTSGALTLYFNVASLVFLTVMVIPNLGYNWAVWSVPGTVIFCIPLLFLVKEKYKRLDIDIEVKSSVGDTVE